VTIDHDRLGREVREEWVDFARQQPNPRRSHLLPWEELGEDDQEVDRRIGRRLYELGRRDAFEGVPELMKLYAQRLCDALVTELSSPYIGGWSLRDRISRVLDAQPLVVVADEAEPFVQVPSKNS
jgi:hypothetical protein